MKIYLLLILFLIPSVNAELIAETSTVSGGEMLNMTVYANNLSSEIYQIIPYTVLEGKGTMTQIRFYCNYDYAGDKPNQNLILRLYTYSGSSFTLIDNTFISPSQCQDNYGYPITWNLFDTIQLVPSQSYAFGMYSNGVSNNGSWQLEMIRQSNISNYSQFRYSWVNISDGLYTSPITNESILNASNGNYLIGNNRIRHISRLQIYGGANISPTPTPNCNVLGSPTYPCGSIIGIGGNETGQGTTSEIPPIFSQGKGISSTLNSSLPTNSTGFKDLLIGQGYPPTLEGAIQMFQDWSVAFVMFGMILFCAKLFTWKKNMRS